MAMPAFEYGTRERLGDQDINPDGSDVDHTTAISPDSRYLVSRSSNIDSDADSTSNALQIWHAGTGEVIGDSFPIPGSVHCIILSPDGRRMICGGEYK
jgi:hypothetical protein